MTCSFPRSYSFIYLFSFLSYSFKGITSFIKKQTKNELKRILKKELKKLKQTKNPQNTTQIER